MLPEWLSNNELFAARIPTNAHSEDEDHPYVPNRKLSSQTDHLNTGEDLLIGSRWSTSPHEVHKVFMDIDVEHHYKPSRTPGHAHLILNCNVTRAELETLMSILSVLGISGYGNTKQVTNHGQTFLRM